MLQEDMRRENSILICSMRNATTCRSESPEKIISSCILVRSFVIAFFVFLITLIPADLFGQDAPVITKDTSSTAMAKRRANKAALFSAVLPGLGQAYNHKYWKMPIIYGGFGTLIYFVSSNNSQYQKYVKAIKFRNDGDASTVDEFPRLSNEDLTARKDFYRRNRDLSYIFTGVLYVLNIVDAYVDSQLMDFDVSDNLSLRTGPVLFQSGQTNTFAGIQLTFTLK